MTSAKIKATMPVSGNTHQAISIRYWYRSRNLVSSHHANGADIKNDSKTNFEKSFDISVTNPETDAPITLRMPISLVRCSAVKAAYDLNYISIES